MKLWWIGAVAAFLVPALVLASPTSRPSGDGAAAVQPIRDLAAAAGLPSEWGDFFAFVAWRESRGRTTATNRSPSEAEAAATAYERNADRFDGCGYEPSDYTWGSGGLWGFLPANAIAQLGKALRCTSPAAVLEPRRALAMAVGYARGLMQWSGYKADPTWLNLRLMWGRPGSGGKPSALAKARTAFTPDADAVGLPASWLDRTPPALTLTPVAVLENLGVA